MIFSPQKGGQVTRLDIEKLPNKAKRELQLKRAFIHIGMHKTGSSAIQSAYKGYNDGKTSYADLGYENHSIPLYTIYSGMEDEYRIWRRSGLSSAQIKEKKTLCYNRLVNCLDQSEAECLIFSGEDISLLPTSGVKEFSRLLKSRGFSAKVIGYARSPISFIISDIQENIKSGTNINYHPGPKFRARFEKFIEVFGRDNIDIREFSRTSLLNGDILSDFANLTNTEVPDKGENDNKGLSTEALKVTYLLNQLVGSEEDLPAVYKSREMCVQELQELLPGKTYIPHDIISPLVDIEDLVWLADCFGIDFVADTPLSNEAFNPDRLNGYLSSPQKDTIESIYWFLKSRHSLPTLPQVTEVIMPRLLMTFLPPLQSSHIQFDPQRYLELNPDVKAAGIDPYRHFVEFGMRELRRF